jgi:2-aminoadipate transaminase
MHEYRLGSWVEKLQTSPMEENLAQLMHSDYISFALGLPDLSVFPKAEFLDAVNNQMQHSEKMMQYQVPEEGMKQEIVKLMYQRGVECGVDEVFICNGAQQGISLILRLLFESKRTVITEDLVYPGFTQALAPYAVQVKTVPSNLQTGISLNALRELLMTLENPAVLYIASEGANPHTVSLSRKKRLEIASLSKEFDLLIIEDDAYGFLNYAESCPPIKVYARENVFYIGSFSKILAPALRVGWVIVPPQLVKILASIKESYDINTLTFSQQIVYALMKNSTISQNIELLLKHYVQKRNWMMTCIRNNVEEELTVIPPQSGFFIWGQTKTYNTQQLLKYAQQEKLNFIPSQSFVINPDRKLQFGLRLNFSNPTYGQIEEGLIRLKKAFLAMKKKG